MRGLSLAQRNQAWYAAWNKTNPNSPLNLYKDGTTIRAQVTSVSFFTRADGVTDLAQVRYFKAKRQAGSAEEARTLLDREHPLHLCGPLERPVGAALEPARLQDRRLSPGARDRRGGGGADGRSSARTGARDLRRCAMSRVGVPGAAVLLAVLAGALASAETIPVAGLTDSRIRTVTYSPDQVYRLYGFVGFHIDLEFESDETFEAISGGDLRGLTYSAHGNVLTLKPRSRAPR